MKYALLIASILLASPPALAQHAHGEQKGPNGGQLQDIADVHAELVTAGNTITINILDESNKPLVTTGYSGSALVVKGSDRETVTLSPSGQNALKGEAKNALAGAAISVTLKTASGKSGQARFKP